MNKALWIAQKNQLCSLIKKISDHYGGDDIEWLRDYCKGIINDHKNNIDKAINCFISLEGQIKYAKNVPRRTS